MTRLLTGFIWFWAAFMIAVNLAVMSGTVDPAAGYGPALAVDGLRLLTVPGAALLHAGFLFGNLVLALPGAAAAALRQHLRNRASFAGPATDGSEAP